jgi:hypothetical protein
MMEKTVTPVSVQAAVSNAMSYVKNLYAGEHIDDLLLEEVEFSESKQQWLITIGFTVSKLTDESTSLLFAKRNLARHYKIVRVDAQTGQPVSMKIREMRG